MAFQVRTFSRYAGYALLCIFLLAIVGLQIADRYIQFRMNDAELQAFLARKNVQAQIRYYNVGTRTIRYASTGQDTAATVVFIHGAPSSLSYYRDYLADSILLGRAIITAIDRPGYGYSDLGRSEPDIAAQARLMAPVLRQYKLTKNRPLILVGASFGSSIAARMAIDYPGLVDGLVLLAPPLKPGAERVFWFSPLIEAHWLKPLVPRMLRVANTEKLAHASELNKMVPLYKNITVPITYLQGENDGLVWPENAAFARKAFSGSRALKVELLPGRGHLIAFDERTRIVAEIVHMLNTVQHP